MAADAVVGLLVLTFHSLRADLPRIGYGAESGANLFASARSTLAQTGTYLWGRPLSLGAIRQILQISPLMPARQADVEGRRFVKRQ